MEDLKLLSISRSDILEEIVNRIENPCFVDTDINMNEKIYYGNIFTDMDDSDLTDEELIQLERLVQDSFYADYILLTY